jgi:hypothetical protein
MKHCIDCVFFMRNSSMGEYRGSDLSQIGTEITVSACGVRPKKEERDEDDIACSLFVAIGMCARWGG